MEKIQTIFLCVFSAVIVRQMYALISQGHITQKVTLRNSRIKPRSFKIWIVWANVFLLLLCRQALKETSSYGEFLYSYLQKTDFFKNAMN